MNARVINIDFDRILEVALLGVRRAAIFMGFGVNAALDPNFQSFQLSALTKIQLVPSDVPADTLQHYKEEFKRWIEGAGLRELSEAFAVFLDSLHHACLLISRERIAEMNTKQRAFRQEGLPNKLNVLQQRFGIESRHAAYLVLINRARNCLTHRRGVVGPEDLRDAETEFVVRWLGTDFFVETPEGERHLLNELPPEGLDLPDGGTVAMQLVERVRPFALGAMLELSTRDLAEICWFYSHEARGMIQGGIAYAERMGVEVRRVDN